MPACEFSEARSGGIYGYCNLVLTDVSTSWFKAHCTKTPFKCPYIRLCPTCKTKNAAASPFCSECGKKLKE
ncbi:MAG: hypothetical protein ACFFD2_12310 [Promethearchaeota archaeon]